MSEPWIEVRMPVSDAQLLSEVLQDAMADGSPWTDDEKDELSYIDESLRWSVDHELEDLEDEECK